MNRLRSFQKKNRVVARRQLLICGEGPQDSDFLKFLKSLYHKRGRGFSIKIKSCSGGSPSSVVNEAWKRKRSGLYHRAIALLDGDRGEDENREAIDKSEKKKVKLIWQKPCLEGELLSILNPDRDFSQRDSQQLKEQWKEAKGNKEYKDIFPKDLLDEARKHNQYLGCLLNLMENGEGQI